MAKQCLSERAFNNYVDQIVSKLAHLNPIECTIVESLPFVHVTKRGHSIDHIPTYFCPRSYWMTPNPLSLPPQHKQITSLREKCSTNPQEILNPVCTGHWMNSNVCSIMCVSSSKSFIKPWRLEETKLSRDSGHTVILELFNLKEFKHFLVYLPVFLDIHRNPKQKYFLKYYWLLFESRY